jgi:N6-L-threonylcarbamoyladenine synthase
MILGLETSCDDTSVAVVSERGEVRALLSADQDVAHRPFGGVVPEVASRHHTEAILPLVVRAMHDAGVSWSQLTGIAVTSRPGLIGSLLVGVVTAKTLALVHGLPLIGVNHIEGHLLAPLLSDADFAPPEGFEFPYLGLAVSGGHTHLFKVEGVGRYVLLGRTRDDAAGEAFDKFAKMSGLGFPGGARVDRAAEGGNPRAFQFPRALMTQGDLDFSFSGLKSAAARQLSGMSEAEREDARADLCASFREAIVDVLVEKLRRASRRTGLKRWAITGGVACNSRLRARGQELARTDGATLAVPPPRYCTDNAAMIAWAGALRLARGELSPQDLSPAAAALPEDWILA